MGMSGLSVAVSGLNAAQAGLYVTGHNMANTDTEGYSRQRAIQSDFHYSRIGENNLGIFQKGLGTDIQGIVQLRDRFLDAAYRIENSRLGFYKVKSEAGSEIESIVGETQSRYNFQSVFLDMWNALNELSTHPEGLETRGAFIATAVSMVTKAEDVYNRLFEYQHNLDGQIRVQVNEVNSLVSQIDKLNRLISQAAMAGDHANDYRDQRNVCLDKLSGIIPIEFREEWDSTVSITAEGKELLSDSVKNHIGLKYIAKEYSFVEPVFTQSTDILPASLPTGEFEPLFVFTQPVNAVYGNDSGSLKGLMMARGTRPATYLGADGLVLPADADSAGEYRYNNDLYSLNNCFIPQVMRDIDGLVHSVITLINDSLAPAIPIDPDNPGIPRTKDLKAPYDLTGRPLPLQYTEVFTRKTIPRWNVDTLIPENPDTLIPEDPGDYYSLYTMGNIRVNPELLQPGGGNLLALSRSGDREDNTLILDLIERWNSLIAGQSGDQVSVNDGYKQLITFIGAETSKDLKFVNEQSLLTAQTNEKRSRTSGVSLDEELKNMMIYQHAYGAAARILSVIDSMLDRVINSMGA